MPIAISGARTPHGLGSDDSEMESALGSLWVRAYLDLQDKTMRFCLAALASPSDEGNSMKRSIPARSRPLKRGG